MIICIMSEDGAQYPGHEEIRDRRNARVALTTDVAQKERNYDPQQKDKKPRWNLFNRNHDSEKGKAPWSAFDNGLKSYDDEFAPLLKVGGINRLTNEIKYLQKRGGEVTAVDLMGTGMMRELEHVDNRLNVSLGYSPNLGVPRDEFVEGNLLQRSTWTEIDNWLESRGQKHFDLIVSRPFGGNPVAVQDLPSYFMLMRNAYRRLSPDNGVLLMQLPNSPQIKPHADEWINRMKESGMDIETNGEVMKLVKNPDSDFNLPA